MFKLFYIEKKKIWHQLDEYVAWKSARSQYVSQDKEQLENFIKFIERDEIGHLTIQDIIVYRNHLVGSKNGQYEIVNILKNIRGFLRYFKARKYICLSPEFVQIDLVEQNSILHDMPTFKRKVGRPVNLEFVKRVKQLRNAELSFRKIGKIVAAEFGGKNNPGRVHRAVNYTIVE